MTVGTKSVLFGVHAQSYARSIVADIQLGGQGKWCSGE